MLDIFTIKQWIFILLLCNVGCHVRISRQLKDHTRSIHRGQLDLGTILRRLYAHIPGATKDQNGSHKDEEGQRR